MFFFILSNILGLGTNAKPYSSFLPEAKPAKRRKHCLRLSQEIYFWVLSEISKLEKVVGQDNHQ
jgi:hypothetical protein